MSGVRGLGDGYGGQGRDELSDDFGGEGDGGSSPNGGTSTVAHGWPGVRGSGVRSGLRSQILDEFLANQAPIYRNGRAVVGFGGGGGSFQSIGHSLGSGRYLAIGQSVTSPGGTTELRLQPDGNLVLYASVSSRPLWATGIHLDARSVVMQADGNLVFLNARGRPIWSAGSHGPRASLVVQDDGNMVIYTPDHRVVWSTRTQGFKDRRPKGGFKFQPWKGVGKFIATAAKNEPITHFLNDIGHGKSFKQSLSGAAKSFGHEFQTVASAAQTVVSVVPGVGTAASMALATGIALSKGQKITQAMLDGVKGALPGGPAAAAAFDASMAFGDGLLHHEKLGKVLLGAVRKSAVDVSEAAGVPSQVAESAFDTGLALAHGKNLQEAGFGALGHLAQGNDLAEKAIDFGHKMTTAAETHQPIGKVLLATASADMKQFAQQGLQGVQQALQGTGPAGPEVSSVLASYPGLGKAAGMALSAGVTLAKGKKIDQVLIETVKAAIPGGPTAQAAFDSAAQFGDGLLHHEKLKDAALGSLAAVRQQAVDAGVAAGIPANVTETAFDTGLAVAHGKSLQDAGFVGLKDLAQGNNDAEKAIDFGHKMMIAAQTHQPVGKVLLATASEEAKALAMAPSSTGDWP